MHKRWSVHQTIFWLDHFSTILKHTLLLIPIVACVRGWNWYRSYSTLAAALERNFNAGRRFGPTGAPSGKRHRYVFW